MRPDGARIGCCPHLTGSSTRTCGFAANGVMRCPGHIGRVVQPHGKPSLVKVKRTEIAYRADILHAAVPLAFILDKFKIGMLGRRKQAGKAEYYYQGYWQMFLHDLASSVS
jgi:hypothetical protein